MPVRGMLRRAGSFRPHGDGSEAGVTTVGNYALQPNWADGHNYGMWTYDRLRTICPCEECKKKSSA